MRRITCCPALLITLAARVRQRPLVVLAAIALTSCNLADSPVEPPTIEGPGPDEAIVDGSREGGNPGFHFQPPISTRIYRPTAEFASDVYEFLSVEVCEWSGAACVGTPIRKFTSESQAASRLLRLDVLKTYIAFWNTRADRLNPDKMYRISVKAGPVTLGYADVNILRRLRDAKEVNHEEFVALPNDWTLPIAFTVAKGALAAAGAALINGAGGTLRVESGPLEGLQLEVPPGALASEQIFAIEETPPLVIFDNALEEGYSLPSFSVETTAGEVAFDPPLTISMTYPDADRDGIIDGTALHAASVQAFSRSAGDDAAAWIPAAADLTVQRVLVSTNHLSEWIFLWRRWHRNTVLDYYVESLPASSTYPRPQLEAELQRAMDAWSSAVDGVVTFAAAPSAAAAQLVIQSEDMCTPTHSAEECEGNALTYGNERFLTRAPYRVVFNTNRDSWPNLFYGEPYTAPPPSSDAYNTTPFLRNALHELGHVMGLGEYTNGRSRTPCNARGAPDPAVMYYECSSLSDLPLTRLSAFDVQEVRDHYDLARSPLLSLGADRVPPIFITDQRVSRADLPAGSAVTVSVSGAIYGDDGVSGPDPLPGVLVWSVTNEQDGSAGRAWILPGTHAYNTAAQSVSFRLNSGSGSVYLLVLGNPSSVATGSLSGAYTATVNGVDYILTEENLVPAFDLSVAQSVPAEGGTATTVEVSGSVYGKDLAPNLDDPLAGIVVWAETNDQDGRAWVARVLQGTHYYKSTPDVWSFTTGSGGRAIQLLIAGDQVLSTPTSLTGQFTASITQ